MDAIDLLRQEHRDIERVLARLQQAIDEARRGGTVHAALFHRAADFLRTQVEARHHLKEHLLHRELRTAGYVGGRGLVKQLSEEHAFGRERTQELLALASGVLSGAATTEALLDAAESYVRLHRAHTVLEERELLPMAQRLLSAEAQERLRSKYARIEASGSLAEAADALDLAFGHAAGARGRAGEARR